MIDKLCPSKRQKKQCAIGYGWDFVWRLWILLLGQPASQLHGEITGNASLIKLHHWNTDAHTINGKIIACHACCGKWNFLPIFADIWLARSSKLFLYGTNELFNHLFLSVLENSQSAVNGLSLSFYLFLLYSVLHFRLFSFRNLFPSSYLKHVRISAYCLTPVYVSRGAFSFSVLNKYQSLNFHVMSLMLSVNNFSPKSKILTKKTDNLDLSETIKFMHTFINVSYFSSCYSNWWGKGSRWPVALLHRSRWHWIWAALK